ncbi:MAG: glutathione S-transferase N-terminal domain-containing protein, partial [Burkholderiales bacterium]
MKLLASLTSPYARKVRIVLAEKRIEYQLVNENAWNADSTVPQFNPLGKVPVLILDDGSSLFDSRVIVEFLDTVTPVSRLIPTPTRQRIAVKKWEALGDGVCDAAVAVILERKRAAEKQN